MTLRTQHDKPVYVRLRETIADAILAGKYGDGDSLPSVRALAAVLPNIWRTPVLQASAKSWKPKPTSTAFCRRKQTMHAA